MGLFSNNIEKLFNTVLEMREQYIIMSANFKNLENTFEKYIEQTDKKISKLSIENEELRKKIIEIEAIINATLKTAAYKAMHSVIREHNLNITLQESIDNPNKLLTERNNTKSNLD